MTGCARCGHHDDPHMRGVSIEPATEPTDPDEDGAWWRDLFVLCPGCADELVLWIGDR